MYRKKFLEIDLIPTIWWSKWEITVIHLKIPYDFKTKIVEKTHAKLAKNFERKITIEKFFVRWYLRFDLNK